MKLVNKEGRFTFIQNKQVKINKQLPKYLNVEKQRESVEKEKKKRESSITIEEHSSRSNVLTIGGGIIETDQFVYEKINQMGESGLKEYLLSENAKGFNQEFARILLGEVDSNNYSISVGTIEDLSESHNNGVDEEKKKPNRFSIFVKKLSKLWKESKEEMEAEKFTVLDLFDLIHIETGKEKEFIDKVSGYFKILNNAIEMGQTTQINNICQNIINDIYESVLFANGYNRYITFSEIVKIQKKSKRIVDIDYIANFNRSIPQEVVDAKKKADELCVFDNYCVLYYDPTGIVEEENKQAKRDPILFGLINHSDKLYYITDWVDELCDLTLEEIAKKYKDVKIEEIKK